MQKIIFAVILNTLSSALGSAEVKLTPFPKSTYYYSNVERSFKDALLECHSQNYRLLSVDDPGEKNIMEEMLREKNETKYYWTSGTDMHSELRFVWAAAGKSVDIIGLEGNLKNFLGAGHCIQTVFANGSLHLLLEVCEKKFLFICEERVLCGSDDREQTSQGPKIGRKARVLGRAMAKADNPKFKEGTMLEHRKLKYFISKDSLKLRWNEAYVYCKSLGMQLWSVETENKNKLMRKVESDGPYWTSGTDMGDHGNWMWMTTGEELGNDELSFYIAENPTFSWTMWNMGKPSLKYEPPENDDQHCLSVHKENLWEDDWCYNKNAFICEPRSDCN